MNKTSEYPLIGPKRQHLTSQHTHNTKGFSLVEVLIGGTLLGILGYASLHLTSNINKSNKTVRSQTSILNHIRSIQEILMDKNNCSSNFNGNFTPITTTKTSTGTINFSAGVYSFPQGSGLMNYQYDDNGALLSQSEVALVERNNWNSSGGNTYGLNSGTEYRIQSIVIQRGLAAEKGDGSSDSVNSVTKTFLDVDGNEIDALYFPQNKVLVTFERKASATNSGNAQFSNATTTTQFEYEIGLYTDLTGNTILECYTGSDDFQETMCSMIGGTFAGGACTDIMMVAPYDAVPVTSIEADSLYSPNGLGIANIGNVVAGNPTPSIINIQNYTTGALEDVTVAQGAVDGAKTSAKGYVVTPGWGYVGSTLSGIGTAQTALLSTKGYLTVQGNTNLNNDLTVTGNSTFLGNSTINAQTVNIGTSPGGHNTIFGDGFIDPLFNVTSIATINGDVTVSTNTLNSSTNYTQFGDSTAADLFTLTGIKNDISGTGGIYFNSDVTTQSPIATMSVTTVTGKMYSGPIMINAKDGYDGLAANHAWVLTQLTGSSATGVGNEYVVRAINYLLNVAAGTFNNYDDVRNLVTANIIARLGATTCGVDQFLIGYDPTGNVICDAMGGGVTGSCDCSGTPHHAVGRLTSAGGCDCKDVCIAASGTLTSSGGSFSAPPYTYDYCIP